MEADVAVGIVECPSHVGHAPSVEVQCGRQIVAFDQVARMDRLLETARSLPGLRFYQPVSSAREHITRVHDPAMVRFLMSVWEDSAGDSSNNTDLLFADTFLHAHLRRDESAAARGGRPLLHFGLYCFDTITGIGATSAVAALGSVNTALTGARLMREGHHDQVIALTRPPGHHAGQRIFGGGCYLNNAAIASQWLRDDGVERVAILDIDFHHGNGTQDIFYEDPTVFYASLHGSPERTYPYFTGYAAETGDGAARGSNLNIELPRGIDGPSYRRYLGRALEAIIAFDPEYLVVSLGLDALEGDPSGDGALVPSDYEQISADIAKLAVPTLAILEGGYELAQLGMTFRCWVAGLVGEDGVSQR